MSPPKVAPVPLADVLRDLRVEASTLRFYQAQFRDCLTPALAGRVQRGLPTADVETLRVIHHLATARGLSAAETRAYLRKRTTTKELLETPGAIAPVSVATPTTAATPTTYGKVITFTSGKGGVGKTSLSLNVAAELARMGLRTALIDADLGLANVHIMAGLTPRHSLEDVVSGRCAMRQALTPGPRGINVLAGASGLLDLADLSARDRARLLEQVEQLEAEHDVVIIDTGAGLSHQVLDFIACADEAVVVTTTELTALADAYAMIKVLARRQASLPVRVLVNRAASAYQASLVLRRLVRCVDRFLDADLDGLAFVPDDPAVARAVQERTPFVVGHPRCRAARATRRIAEQLMAVELRRGESGGPQATLARWLERVRPPAPTPAAQGAEA